MWIKCSESLPDVDDDVLVYVEPSPHSWRSVDGVFMARISSVWDGAWECSTIGVSGYDYEVESGFQPTHWQPLPKGPNE